MAIVIRMRPMLGSLSRSRKRSLASMRRVRTATPRVASVTGPASVSTVRPSTSRSSASTLGATRSTTWRATAWSSPMDTLWRTASSAHWALRPRRRASARMPATASLVSFSIIVASCCPPCPTATGWAAPMRVAGAIAAMFAA